MITADYDHLLIPPPSPTQFDSVKRLNGFFFKPSLSSSQVIAM